MQTTLISHPKLRVDLKTGAEGPRHDPYHFEELNVQTPSGETVLHLGFETWVEHNGHRLELPDDNQSAGMTFEKLCGYSREMIERIHIRLRSRCRKCGGKSFHCVEGYPGETFDVCAGCSEIRSTYFDRSAVE